MSVGGLDFSLVKNQKIQVFCFLLQTQLFIPPVWEEDLEP